MIDTRCYKCVVGAGRLCDIDFSPDRSNFHPDYAHKQYQGGGIFKCPRCDDVTDLSSKTYTIKVSREYDEDGSLFSNILEFDPKFSQKSKEVFKDDMLELDIFENFPWGRYILDVMWYYYQCGSYEYPDEWDVKIEILSDREVIE